MNKQLEQTRAGQMRAPYDFNRSILFPFKSGPNSAAFVFKSAALYALITTILFLVFGKWIMSAFTDLFNNMAALDVENSEPDFNDFLKILSFFGEVFLPLMLMSVLGWIVMVMIEAAFYRRVFFGEDKPFPWRFGGDEITVMLSQFMFGLIMFGIGILFYAVMGAAMLAIGVTSAGGEVNGAVAALVGIIMFVSIIGFFVLIIFTMVRLSPIAALSVARGRVSIKEAWQVTKGRFWIVFASFIVVMVLASIINYVLQMIIMVVLMGSFGSMAEKFEGIDDTDGVAIMTAVMDVVTTPAFLIGLAIFIFIYAAVQTGVRLLYAGVTANAVDLYRQDLGENDLEVFD